MKSNYLPIEDPKRVFCSQELFFMNINRIDDHKERTGGSTIGDVLTYASVEAIKVKTVELNSQETGVVVNKTTDNIQIPFDQTLISAVSPGVPMDSLDKVKAVCSTYNDVQHKKAIALQKEAENAVSFLRELLVKGA